MNLEAGQVVGGYTLVSRLGAGAMGSVWRARDDGGHEYAMKILRDSLDEDGGEEERRETVTARERLRREAMSLKKVNHPGVCGIVDMELDDALAFIVTELIEGRNLKDDVAANGRYVGDDLERLAAKLIDAVKAVHAAGIVHRDIKPTNVMVSATGPVLVDFGIAMGEGESHVTRTGLVMGTPGFIAPEIIDGAESDEQTDWWSLASVLAFAATGEPVFGTRPMMAVLERAAAGSANLAGLPAGTMAAFRSALDPDRSRRCGPDELLHAIALDAPNPLQPGMPGQVVHPFDETSPRTMWVDRAELPGGTRVMPADGPEAGQEPQTQVLHPEGISTEASTLPVSHSPVAFPSEPQYGEEEETVIDANENRSPDPYGTPYAQETVAQEPAPPTVNPADIRRGRYLKRSTPVLLALAAPVALAGLLWRPAAPALALALFWTLLTAGYSTEALLRREGRRGGIRTWTDGAWRVAAFPWHLVKGLAFGLPRALLMTLLYALLLAAAALAFSLPWQTQPINIWPYAMPMLDDSPVTALAGALAGAIAWWATAWWPRAAFMRLGAGALRGHAQSEQAHDMNVS